MRSAVRFRTKAHISSTLMILVRSLLQFIVVLLCFHYKIFVVYKPGPEPEPGPSWLRPSGKAGPLVLTSLSPLRPGPSRGFWAEPEPVLH